MAINDIEQLTSSHLRNEVLFFEFKVEGIKTKFATNIFKVKEVLVYNNKFVDIFSEVDYIDGIANIRGVTIPVIDLVCWLKSGKSNSRLLMICDFLNVLVGIRISEAIGIKTKRWDEFVRSDNKKIIGYYKDDNEIVEVLDLEKMVSEAFPFLEKNNEEELEEVNDLSIKKLYKLCRV